MHQLNLKTPDSTISINLVGDVMTIDMSRQEGLLAALEDTREPELEWSETLLDGESVNYADAEKAVAALGEGWRLPTRQELESLVDTSRHDPAIDIDRFPDTKSCRYWTSTPCAWNDAAVWCVDFYYGFVGGFHRYLDGCVRAVRPGQ